MVDLPLRLDRAYQQTLSHQLVEQLRRAVLDGRLTAGTRLPSTRALALDLGVSRNVVLAAYDELYAEGYVEGRHGSGTYIAHDLPVLPRPSLPAPSGNPRWLHGGRIPVPVDDPHLDGGIEFRLGRPSVAPLQPRVWRQIWDGVAGSLPPPDYGPPGGDPELRAAITGYLGRARGVACGADDVVVTSGAIQALDLVARAVLAPGDAAAFEEPGYPVSRQVLEGRGARLVPVAVDDDGMRIELLPNGAHAPLLVYLTPSHQYPLGARLPLPRRVALLEWSRENDALVVEDDYDSEFRFDAPPLPALAGLDDAGQVAYIGTFSKVLTPALRVGYLVAPAPLRERVERLKRLSDFHTPWPVQRALATFIREGHLERHVRRMRRHYAEKRALLRDTLEPVGDVAQLRGLEAGLHAYLDLARHIDARQVADRAMERGVVVSTLEGYYAGPVTHNGLLLGYGGLSVEQIERGAGVIVDIIRRCRG
jgi:GntR family transcriptional regulator/MocR family aminotransferase